MALIAYGAHRIEPRAGESLLEACLRLGIDIPFSCRAGSCHVCMLRAVEGVPPQSAQRGIPARLAAKGYFLPCRCQPEGALTVALPDPNDLSFDALLVERQLLASGIGILKFEVAAPDQFHAGQHVNVHHPDGSKRTYSISSVPEQDYFVELHVAPLSGGKFSTWLRESLAVGSALTLSAPSGALQANRVNPQRPILMLATGTGLGPLMAIARELLAEHPGANITLMHGASRQSGLYRDVELREWPRRYPNFEYVRCCSQEPSPDLAAARVTDALRARILPDDVQVLAAGHPDMLREAEAWLLQHGVFADSLFFDPYRRAGNEAAAVVDHAKLWQALADGALLHRALTVFYARVFADPKLSPYFRGVTEQRLIEKQYSFLKSLITGSKEYFGQRPRNAHHWMVISEELFDYRLGLMRTALAEQGLSEPYLSQCHAIEEQFRADIVKDHAWPRVIDGRAVMQDGFATERLDCSTLCDGCGSELLVGSVVRFHRRLGTVYCADCMNSALPI